MASGYTTTGSLADSLPKIMAAARLVRDQEGVMQQLCDKTTLGEGEGLDWNEITLAQLTASNVGETDKLDNPQQISDTLAAITPTVAGIHTVLTRKVKQRLAKVTIAKLGALAQNAMERKKDIDGLTILDGATTSLAGAGVITTSGHLSAAVSRIKGNTTEPGNEPIYIVLHPFQIKSIQDEIATVGTYPIPEGETARVYREGFSGAVSGARVYAAGNLTIDSSDDAKGGVFAKEAIRLIQGSMPRRYTKILENMDGAEAFWMYDEYAYGERSAGNWLYEIYSDATAPTS